MLDAKLIQFSVVMMIADDATMKLAPGVSLLQVTGLLPSLSRRRERVFRVSVLVLTFLAYTSYHLSRKPISIVKNSDAFLHCGTNHSTREHEQHNSTECT